MLPVIISFTALLIIILFQFLAVRKLEGEKNKILFVLGYYRVRFGYVSPEDIANNVGITDENVSKYQEEKLSK